MKKSRSMRLASALLVLTLLSTCMISGTFAKYVTTAGGEDSARVAKFGVVIEVNDDLGLFATEYTTDGEGITVRAENGTDQIIAPGTAGSMTFSIKGKPEVKTELSVTFDENTKTVTLPAGSYTLGAGEYANSATTYTTTDVYEPVKFYFGPTTDYMDKNDCELSLEELKEAMSNANSFAKKYDVNYNFETVPTYTLAWYWPFETEVMLGGENIGDFLDTYLGKAGTAEIKLDFDIKIEQID